MSRRYPEWDRDGADWPHRAASRFVSADGYRWHVQSMEPTKAGAPLCVLIHGTGAATHSWRDLMPLLAKKFRVVAIDLPGHGFTRPDSAKRVTLPAMAQSLALLLDQLDATPDIIVGHSAGTAVGLQMMLDKGWQNPLVGFTPALMPFPGLAARLFPQLAKMLFANPFAAEIFARIARSPGETEKFLRRATGSRIDAGGATYYQRLFSRPGHCEGAIRMMANWRLEDLQRRLPTVAAPVLLVHATRDGAIPKSAVTGSAALIPGCETLEIPDLGHLAHEEDAAQAAAIIVEFAKKHRKR